MPSPDGDLLTCAHCLEAWEEHEVEQITPQDAALRGFSGGSLLACPYCGGELSRVTGDPPNTQPLEPTGAKAWAKSTNGPALPPSESTEIPETL